ncbi:LysR family transcriptional regulator [Cohnella nanjingensis]|uniref:LysR family transcriptional regulator n=1 Tax=Cohnella nanjingensis TaxID=1387779 RepID=A0A7X0VE41_9BACL|nr:LysR family transcriptional regulator [Cohnella nanjingensis]MBB6669878.1 LysR family transcriptional regulator [Cohnella nanjingensis]
MEWNQMEYFLTVARLQHVTRAAEVLSITQPALSHSIAKLEEELGVQLFERSGRNVQLNRYGELFAHRVERALQEIEKGKQEVEELTNPESGVVSLAFLNVLGTRLVPMLVRSFRERHPGIRFELNQGTCEDNLKRLAAGGCDLIVSAPRCGEDGIAWGPITDFKVDLVVPAGHPLSGRDSVTLGALAGEPFIGLKNQCGLRLAMDRMFGKWGFDPLVAYEAEDLPTVAGFISAGLGISLLPRTAGVKLEGIEWVKLDAEDNEFEVGLEWKEKRYLSPAARLFRDHVLEKNLALRF